jgi:hypothetical protein
MFGFVIALLLLSICSVVGLILICLSSLFVIVTSVSTSSCGIDNDDDDANAALDFAPPRIVWI